MCNYIIGSKAGLGILAREATEQGSLLYAIIYFSAMHYQHFKNGKNYGSWEHSNFRNSETGGFHWFNFFGVIWYIINLILSGVLVIFAYKYAILADINQGILSTLFALAALFSAIIAYFVFGEKLKLVHVS